MIGNAIRKLAYWVRERPGLARWVIRVIPDPIISRSIPNVGLLRFRLRTNRAMWLRDPCVTDFFPLTALRVFVRPGGVVCDLGANLGLYSRYLVSVCGAGRVIAFEPWERNVSLLRENLRVGHIEDRVQILQVAACDFDGAGVFQVDDVQSTSGRLDVVSPGQPSVGRANLGLPPVTIKVVCGRLDTLIARRVIPPPSVMKVDVEGAELRVLRGASQLLRFEKPSLVIELHSANCLHEVVQYLEDAGYGMLASVTSHLDPRGFRRFDTSVAGTIAGDNDVLFIAASHEDAELAELETRLGARRAEGLVM